MPLGRKVLLELRACPLMLMLLVALALGQLVGCSQEESTKEKNPPDDSLKRYFEVQCLRVESCNVYTRASVLKDYAFLGPLSLDVYLVPDLSVRSPIKGGGPWPSEVERIEVLWDGLLKSRGVFVIKDGDLKELARFINDDALPGKSGLTFHTGEHEEYVTLEGKLLGNFLAALSQSSPEGLFYLRPWERYGGDLDEEFSYFVKDLCILFQEVADKSSRRRSWSSCKHITPEAE